MKRHFLLLVLVSLALWVRYSPADAHTAGKIQLSAAPAGPFKMTVWTWPDPATIGELHVTVAVVMAEDAAPVLDGDLLVQLTPIDGGPTISAPASTENSVNKFLYEAVLEPVDSGVYDVTLFMTGSDGSTGDASFELEIRGDSTFDPLYLIPVALGLAAVVFLVFAVRGRSTSKDASPS